MGRGGCAARSHRHDAQPFQSLEMPAIVAEQRKIVVYRGCADKDVHIADEISGGAQSSSLLAEYLADVLVQMNDFKVCKEVSQGQSFGLWVSRIECAFIEFGKRNDTQADALRTENVKSTDYGRDTALIIDNPIGISQILHSVKVFPRRLILCCGLRRCIL